MNIHNLKGMASALICSAGILCACGPKNGTESSENLSCMTVNTEKPRVIVMTDGEVDDRCSMVHFLLSTNDLEVEAIIETNSCFQKNGWSSINWLGKQIDDYAKVYPNLIIHDPDFPTPEYLRSICFVGDEDTSHIPEGYMGSMVRPGAEVLIDPSQWEDTPGSKRIEEILLDSDERTIYFLAWGGSNTAARAFYNLRKNYPDTCDELLSKVVMYNIWYQDGAGSYIEQNFPTVTMLLSNNFSGTWDYDSQRYMDSFIQKYLRGDFGPLSVHYVQDPLSEGDSPSFFHCLGNGLRSFENPAFGGWGGQFHKHPDFDNVYVDNDKGSYMRWTEYVNRDFEARLRWCVADKYEKANHRPEIELETERYMTVQPGDTVYLKATAHDNDGPDAEAVWRSNIGMVLRESHGVKTLDEFIKRMDEFSGLVRMASSLRGSWWQYPEAGTYKGFVNLSRNKKGTYFIAPEIGKPETIHMIFEATDKGTPPMSSFERVVVTVKP